METVLVALLGGGLAGAIVSGAMTLLAQRRAFEHERKTRFLDLRRERYAALLRDSDAQLAQARIGIRSAGDWALLNCEGGG